MAQGRLSVLARLRMRISIAVMCLAVFGLARADVEIEIRGVEEDLRENVLAYLSLARYEHRDLDADTIERLHNRIERETKSALRPFGYYDPVIKSEIIRRDKNNWRTIIDITPGEPVLMESVAVRIQGEGSNDPLFQRIVDRPSLRSGDRLSHAAYERVKGDLQRTAATYGYLDAKLTRSDLLVDPETHRASIVLEMETGPRYRFGTTTLEQDAVDPALIRRFMRYEQDEPFDVTDLLRTQFALDDSQYFATVEVTPGEPNREEHIVPVSIRAEPGRRDRYSLGAGYGTDSGPRGTALWDRRRVNHYGHRFNLELEAATQSQTVASTYSIPIGDPALEKLALKAALEQQDIADLNTEEMSIEPSITRVRGRWQHVLFVTAARVVTDDGFGTDVDRLLIPGISIASVPQNYLGEALFQRGFFAELRGSHNTFGSDENFLQLHTQLERVFPVTQGWHLLLRGELGASLVGDLSELPGTLRFFAGGDRSVRGFGFNDLSPVKAVFEADGVTPVLDEDGNQVYRKIGGRHVVTGTVEIVRELPRSMGIAAFMDFGNAFDEFGHSPDPLDSDFLEYSVGLGFRWRLPVVTLGVDIAQALSESGAGPRLHINFSPKL